MPVSDKTKTKVIDNYISDFPEHTQKLLQQLRAIIQKAAPQAEETINYGIPTFTLSGNLVHFAGYKNHIGFYPAPSAIKAFSKELSVYKGAKGSVQFPLDKTIPSALISRIVKFRVKENLEKEKAKSLRTCSKGHKYYKSSDCPVCPICEQKRKPQDNFLSLLPAPARRALENKGIKTLQQLSRFSEAEILELHGMGPGSLPKLRSALKAKGLLFKRH
jgi:uncharacterized protein YdhG (YjbR/CyaY superfamily)